MDNAREDGSAAEAAGWRTTISHPANCSAPEADHSRNCMWLGPGRHRAQRILYSARFRVIWTVGKVACVREKTVTPTGHSETKGAVLCVLRKNFE